jgi:hypothetical protein
MNAIPPGSKHFNPLLLSLVLAASAGWLAAAWVHGAAIGKTFASPEEAVGALATAVNHRDTNALATIFGPAVAELRSPDPVQAQNEITEFAERLNASNHIERPDPGR